MKIQFFLTFEKWLEHLWNSLIMLEIGGKSFENRWSRFEVDENLSATSVIFGSRR